MLQSIFTRKGRIFSIFEKPNPPFFDKSFRTHPNDFLCYSVIKRAVSSNEVKLIDKLFKHMLDNQNFDKLKLGESLS